MLTTACTVHLSSTVVVRCCKILDPLNSRNTLPPSLHSYIPVLPTPLIPLFLPLSLISHLPPLPSALPPCISLFFSSISHFLPPSLPPSLPSRPKEHGDVNEGGEIFTGSGQKEIRIQQEEKRGRKEDIRSVKLSS